MVPILYNSSLAIIHYSAIESYLVHHISRVLDDGGIWKNPRVIAPAAVIPLASSRHLVPISAGLESFLIGLLDLTNNSLRELICLEPSKLELYVDNLNLNYPTFIDLNSNDCKILSNIFVNSIYEKLAIFNKFNFISNIGLNTCPYCNRNYIYAVNKRKVVKPEIDHFYPESKYPILAVSYSNLIPSCQSCNGLGAKGKQDPYLVGIISPYLIKTDDFRFTLKIKNISAINPLCGKTDVEVLFKNKVQNNCDVFNLDDLYSLHHDHAIELLIKRRLKYSKKYRDYLNSYDNLTFNKSEIDRMILGNYSLEKEQSKRPLSKLYQDIGKELGLIKEK